MSFTVHQSKRQRVIPKTFNTDNTRVEQHHKDSCDIHKIVKQATRTGVVAHMSKVQGEYKDLSNAPDFHKAMNIIATANSVFEEVPSKLRARFHNDPAEFLDYLHNPANREDMIKNGFSDAHLPPLPSSAAEVPTTAPSSVDSPKS